MTTVRLTVKLGLKFGVGAINIINLIMHRMFYFAKIKVCIIITTSVNLSLQFLQLDSERKRPSEDNLKMKQQLESVDNFSAVKEFDHCQKVLALVEAALRKIKTVHSVRHNL